MNSYHIKLIGCFKPYVRMTQRGKYVRPEAKEYLASKDELQRQLACELVDCPMLPESTPLSIQMVVEHGHGFHNRDLDNEVKAILDAMQGIVFKNDCWVDHIAATRYNSDRCAVDIIVFTG